MEKHYQSYMHSQINLKIQIKLFKVFKKNNYYLSWIHIFNHYFQTKDKYCYIEVPHKNQEVFIQVQEITDMDLILKRN